jgi:type 1 glutamine amidotransferase
MPRDLLTLCLSAGLVALGLLAPPRPGTASQPATPTYAILVFTRTAGFRHDSIPDGVAAIEALGAEHGFAVDHTEDPTVFSDAGLAPYRAVVFLSTTGHVLEADQQRAFERYIGNGGGYVGIHSATDTEYDWAWYGGLVGAYFSSHPEIQTARVHIEDASDPATAMLPDPWVRTDEWYSFRANPRANGVHVLLTLDESSYNGGTMGADHPIAWYHAYAGGRAWYTAGGHTSESFSEPLFVAHLLGGIQYAAGIPSDEPAVLAGRCCQRTAMSATRQNSATSTADVSMIQLSFDVAHSD